MNSSTLWKDSVPSKDKSGNSCADSCISPDGSRVIVAVGNKVNSPHANYMTS